MAEEEEEEEEAEPEEVEHRRSLVGVRTKGAPGGRAPGSQAPASQPASGWQGQTESDLGFGAWRTKNFGREKEMEKFGGLRFPVM